MSEITLILSPPPPPAVIVLTPPEPPPVLKIDEGRGPQGPPGIGVETIGNIDDLTTDNKTTLVAAINELNMAGVSLSLLYDNAKAG